jgi:hypothetical protein
MTEEDEKLMTTVNFEFEGVFAFEKSRGLAEFMSTLGLLRSMRLPNWGEQSCRNISTGHV